MNANPFEKFSHLLSQNGPGDAIEMLRQEFLSSGNYHQLFEVLKIRCRQRLGLPLLFSGVTDADDQHEQLETGLLEACKEVGTLLFQAGRPEEGWVFLQPVGDARLAKRLLMEIEVTAENRDLMIDLGLGQGIAPAWAFEIIIQANGTCDAITAIDMQIHQGDLPKPELETIAETLLEFFYNEAVASVQKDINNKTEDSPTDSTLGQMLEQYPWLVSETDPHVDTTHLNSVVRIARKTSTAKHFRMALDLCRYGQRLGDDFKHRCEPPFESPYEDHAHYFEGLLNGGDENTEAVKAAIAHFTHKLATAATEDRTIVAEELIAWLVRMGRSTAALEMHIEHLTGQETWGVAPSIIKIADSPELKQQLMRHLEATGDLLGFAVCQLQQQGQTKK